jgi:hypothetical protein
MAVPGGRRNTIGAVTGKFDGTLMWGDLLSNHEHSLLRMHHHTILLLT